MMTGLPDIYDQYRIEKYRERCGKRKEAEIGGKEDVPHGMNGQQQREGNQQENEEVAPAEPESHKQGVPSPKRKRVLGDCN
jgi:hypothetical protein